MKICITCFAWLLAAASTLDAQEYDVVFHRNAKVGDKYLIETQASMDDDQEFVVNGKSLESNKHVKLEVELAVLVENVAVDKNGYPAEQKMSVKKSRCVRDGSPVELFKAGDTIIMKNDKPRQFMVNGKAAEGLQRTTLDQIFPSSGDDPGSDDRIFSPGRKVKIGESWPVNAEAAAVSLSKKLSSPVSKDAVKGTIKLVSANPKNGVSCLQLSGELLISAGGRGLPGAPPEIQVRKFVSTFTLGGDFPVDPQRQPLTEQIKMTSEVEGGGITEKDGAKSDVTFRLARTQKKESTITPAP
jgi:hypothetical protein